MWRVEISWKHDDKDYMIHHDFVEREVAESLIDALDSGEYGFRVFQMTTIFRLGALVVESERPVSHSVPRSVSQDDAHEEMA